MNLKDLKAAIEDMEKHYGYEEDTPVHVKDSNGGLKLLDGFHVGINGRIFLK